MLTVPTETVCVGLQVARLAEKAPDRNTRVAGCEFLHAVTLWMIGKPDDHEAASVPLLLLLLLFLLLLPLQSGRQHHVCMNHKPPCHLC